MSTYTDCSAALRELVAAPPEDHQGVFTEIDVVNRASKAGWTTPMYKRALRDANNIMGEQFRNRKLCRYGPVSLPNGKLDFARIASKMVYAHPNGPDEWVTPNGTFPKMMTEDDTISAPGRKFLTSRDDTKPWADQDISEIRDLPQPSPELPREALERTIAQLEADLAAMKRRAEEAEAETTRLRTRLAANGVRKTDDVQAVAREIAAEVVGDLENRINELSDRFERIRGAIAA